MKTNTTNIHISRFELANLKTILQCEIEGKPCDFLPENLGYFTKRTAFRFAKLITGKATREECIQRIQELRG